MTPTRDFGGGEALWRCTSCGKWSHAKRRPPHHQRFVGDELPAGAKVADTGEVVESDTGARSAVFWIRCGPFEEWAATRATA